MRLQLLVSFLLVTILLAGLTGHAAYSPCKSPEGSPARQLCEDIAREKTAANTTYAASGDTRDILKAMRDKIDRIYELASQEKPDFEGIQRRYESYLKNKEELRSDAPKVYASFFEQRSGQIGGGGANSQVESEKRAQRIQAAFTQEQARQQQVEAEVKRQQEEKRISDQTMQTNEKLQAARAADREQIKEWSQVPRCYASGFPVGTSEKARSRCERVTDLAGALKAMRLDSAKGLENMKGCGSRMLCNPFTFGATKVGATVQPICVKPSKFASDECESRSGQKQKQFRAELLKDPKNLAALENLHRNLVNSCGLTEDQKKNGVEMKHVLKAGRALGQDANSRLDDSDFVRTCTKLLTLTSTLVTDKSAPAAAHPIQRAGTQ